MILKKEREKGKQVRQDKKKMKLSDNSCSVTISYLTGKFSKVTSIFSPFIEGVHFILTYYFHPESKLGKASIKTICRDFSRKKIVMT